MKKTLIVIIAICLLLLTGCQSNSKESSFEGDYSVKYNMKINPEFKVYADENLIIVAIEPLNEDAEAVLNAIDVVGMTVANAFSAITEESKAQGFMTAEKGNTVNIDIEEMDEETMEVCPVCEGCGTIECWDCNGAGADPCVRCSSTGIIYEDDTDHWEWQICPQCNGLAITTTPDDNCWACHGSGTCYLCEGIGYVTVYNPDGEINYTLDGVPETSTCSFCNGTGKCTNCLGIACHRCNSGNDDEKPGYVYEPMHYSDGRECPDCTGTGKITCGCELNGRRWCPCCWGSGIDGTGYENYDYSLTPYENWYNNRYLSFSD